MFNIFSAIFCMTLIAQSVNSLQLDEDDSLQSPFHDIIHDQSTLKFIEFANCSSISINSSSIARVLTFKSCSPYKVLIEVNNLSQIIENSQYIFTLSFEVDTKLRKFSTLDGKKIAEIFKKLNRQLLINIYSSKDHKEVNYFIEKGRMSSDNEFLSQLLTLSDYQSALNKALQSNCAICLRILQLIDLTNYILRLEISENIERLSCDVDCFRALLILPFNFNFDEIPKHVYLLLQDKYVNGLKLYAAKAVMIDLNYTAEEFLSENSFKMDLEGITTLAWLQRQYKVFDFLIRADCFYPNDNFFQIDDYFDDDSTPKPRINRYIKKLKLHIDAIDNFHSSIANGNVNEVKDFLSQNKIIKFARNVHNKSALRLAFENEQWEIYAILKSYGMQLGDLTEIASHYEAIETLESSKKDKIRQYNYKHLTPIANETDYIEKLVQKTKINFPKSISKEKIIAEVYRAYCDVNKTASEILKISSMSENLEIIFDFDYSIIDDFEPGMNAVGVTVRQYNYVVIAASQLLSRDIDERNYALGTIAHELTHFAMYLLYDNDANPYKKGDKVTKNFLRNITEEAKENDEIESFYSYSDSNDDFHVEIIARVPDILLTHQRNESRLSITKKVYKKLFDFYENQVLNDVRKLTPTMAVREKLRDYNQWFDVVSSIANSDYEIDIGFCDEIEVEDEKIKLEEDEEEESDESEEEKSQKMQRLEEISEEYNYADSGIESESSEDDYFDVKINKLSKNNQNRKIFVGNEDFVDEIGKELKNIKINDQKMDKKEFLKLSEKSRSHKNVENKQKSHKKMKNTKKYLIKSRKHQDIDKKQRLLQQNHQNNHKQHQNHSKHSRKFQKHSNHPKNHHKTINNPQNVTSTTNTYSNNSSQLQDFSLITTIFNIFNLTFTPDANKFQIIISNFPPAIQKSLYKITDRENFLAVFMELSSSDLDNIVSVIHSIDNMKDEILLVIICDDVEHLKNFMEILEGTTLKNVIFIASETHLESFDDEIFVFNEIKVNLNNLCPKSRENLLDAEFYFQDDKMTLRKIIGSDYNDLDFLPLNDIYNEDINAIAADTLSKNEDYFIDRKFIDSDGSVKGLKDFVAELFKIDEKKIASSESDETEDEDDSEENELVKKIKYVLKTANNIKKSNTNVDLITQNITKTTLKLNESSDSVNSSSIFIISDLPGSGKSTAVKQIALEIRKKSPSHWIVFVDLNDVQINQFDTWNDSEILEFFTQKILQTSNFDSLMFEKFFKTRRVILIFDNFNNDENVTKLINQCAKHVHQIWLATESKYEKLINGKILKFSPLDRNEIGQFLEYFDEHHEVKVLKFISEIGMKNLRLIKEVAEIIEEIDETANWYRIFTRLIYNRGFENSIKNDEFDLAKMLSSPLEILKIHQQMALYHLYKIKLNSTIHIDILNYQLIHINSNDQMKFVDEIIAEFFAAQYFIEEILKNDVNDDDWKLFTTVKKSRGWNNVRKFICDYIMINGDKLNESRVKKASKVLN